MVTAAAQAFSNIAFIKYWGDRDPSIRLPANGSISMNLGGLHTQTMVSFDPALEADCLAIDGKPAAPYALERVSGFLDRVRRMAGLQLFARVESSNNFPMAAGIASSASAFAALALAASQAAGLDLAEKDLSRLARLGSGSACRSVPGGFVEWQAGQGDEDSYAYSIAPPAHWDLADCIAVVSRAHKPTGSREGHALAVTSPLQPARLSGAPQRLDACRKAILNRDFDALAAVAELDSNLMHSVIMTSNPPVLYWEPATVTVMHAVQEWRRGGLPVCYTIDAGPNVHLICPKVAAGQVAALLAQVPGVIEVFTAIPGGPARILEDPSC